VTSHLQQRADEQDQVPDVDAEEIQQHSELAIDQYLTDDLRYRLRHRTAASGRSRICWAMSAAKASSPLRARRRNSTPGAPIARSARAESRRTRQVESRSVWASFDAACQYCIRPKPCAAAALTCESESLRRSVKRPAEVESPIEPRR